VPTPKSPGWRICCTCGPDRAIAFFKMVWPGLEPAGAALGKAPVRTAPFPGCREVLQPRPPKVHSPILKKRIALVVRNTVDPDSRSVCYHSRMKQLPSLGVQSLGVLLEARGWGVFATSMSPQPTPQVSSADVERVVARDFPSGCSHVWEILRGYNSDQGHQETARVCLAALKLAAGNIHRLASEIKNAQRDYRDVLAAAEYPEYCRSVGWSGRVSPAEQERVINADREQYSEWLAR
jgi:hypothetical protein